MSNPSTPDPEYPESALPECARPIVTELAELLDCSPSLPATLALGVMSGAAGRSTVLGKCWPNLWAVVKTGDSEAFDVCMSELLSPLKLCASELLEEEDAITWDGWDDYESLINRSPDAAILLPVSGKPFLFEQGWDDGSVSCVGRMDSESWLQPSLWRRVLCADCRIGIPRRIFDRQPAQTAREAWLNALRGIMVQRLQVAGRPRKLQWSTELEQLVYEHDYAFTGLRIAVLLSLFRGEPRQPKTVVSEDIQRTSELAEWYARAKKRMWHDAHEHPWGDAWFGDVWSRSSPAGVAEVIARREARSERKICRRGIPSRSATEGFYLLIPDPEGVPCGHHQFRQVSGPKLSSAVIRGAINDIETLARAANRREMHYDFGIWHRSSPQGLAAAVWHGCWSAIAVWEIAGRDELGGTVVGRPVVKSIWVALEARRQGLASELLSSIAEHAKLPPLIAGPFTASGALFADAWYAQTGGAPAGWKGTNSEPPAV